MIEKIKQFMIWVTQKIKRFRVSVTQIIIILALIGSYYYELWPFDSPLGKVENVGDLISIAFSDTVVLGIFNITVLGFGIYVLLSLVNHILTGRWWLKISAKGMEVEPLLSKNVQMITRRLESAQVEIAQVKSARDDLLLENKTLSGIITKFRQIFE